MAVFESLTNNRRLPSPHRAVLVLLTLTSLVLLSLVILGTRILKTVPLFQIQLVVGIGRLKDTFEVRLGTLGFCHGSGFDECSPPAFPYRFFANSIGELSSVPIAKDAIGGLETALSSLAVGFLVFLLIAGPLTLFAFVNDAFRPLPSLASKTSIALSFLSGTFALAGYVATVVVFGSLGAAVVVAGEAPGVEGSAGRGVAVRMALAAGIIQLVAGTYKLGLIKTLRNNNGRPTYSNDQGPYEMELKGYP